MAIHDDELKRLIGSGIDPDRVAQAYERTNGGLESLQARLASGYLMPKEIDLAGHRDAIQHLLWDGKVAIIVPMRERGPVIRPLLTTLASQRLPSRTILVVNDGSDDDALNEVRQHGENGVHLAFRDDILDVLNWERLLPVLNLEERPRGKGVAVLAGYLYWYLLTDGYLGQRPDWIGQTDSEIAEFHRYLCWNHLGYGMVTMPNAQYVKMAKFGRTNERCMAARWMLFVLASSDRVDPSIRGRAEEICYRLGRHKWMLTGEFALRWKLAVNRPFATGYLEETVTSLFAEDYCARHYPGTDAIVQVGNPNPRLDAANDDRKESLMQQQISNFLLTIALEGVPPVDQWDVETITRLNHTVMAKPLVMGWIPPNEGPVVAEAIRNDRIIPSITMLDRAGLIDWRKAEHLIAR